MMICWYLQYGLRLTEVHQLVEYKQGKPSSWFSEEVANARHDADKDLLKSNWEINVAKLKRNSFYWKMIEDLGRHKSTKFTCEERVVEKALRSPVFFLFFFLTI